MKILISSHFFHPSVGGIETVTRLLAREFVRAGHEVKVVTQTRECDEEVFPFEVIRAPRPLALISLVRWCDVFFQNNISLQTAWPLLLVRRPWIVAHHTWIAGVDGRSRWRDRLKHFVLRFAKNISISTAVASHLRVESIIVGDPYDENFTSDESVARNRELVCVGRLVSDKGVDLLIEALHQLQQSGLRPRLTIDGGGPELEPLRRQTQEAGLEGQIVFAGKVSHAELRRLLHAHKIMVVPSRWNEPFGMVALEGIACGCVVAGSDGGGLPAAIGACGLTFPKDDAAALARVLARLLTDDALVSTLQKNADEHLARHRPEAVAREYLRVLEAAR